MLKLTDKTIGKRAWLALKWSTCFLVTLSLCVPSWAVCVCECQVEEIHKPEPQCCKHHHTSSDKIIHNHSKPISIELCQPLDCRCQECPSSKPIESRLFNSPSIELIEDCRSSQYPFETSYFCLRKMLPADWQLSLPAANHRSLQVLLCVWSN